MVAKNENVALSPGDPEIEECDHVSLPHPRGFPAGRSFAKPSVPPPSILDGFYEKLCKVNESTGLSLLFNFRETSLDLYLFYKMVTERGGYHKVTRDGSWGEVASALSLKSRVLMSPTQLQKLYMNLLYQFEQTYHYRTPGKVLEAPSKQGHTLIEDYSKCSPGKRKHSDRSQFPAGHYSSDDSPSKKTVFNNQSCQISSEIPTVPSPEEQKLNLQPSVKEKEMNKNFKTPLGPRSGYQIFIKIERDRLKRIHGESPSGLFRDMAIAAWRNLSENDRKPYLEASKKDKERYIREMSAYNQRAIENQSECQCTSSSRNLTFIEFAYPSEKDYDYHHAISQLEANDCQNFPSSAIQKVIDFAKPLQTDVDYHVALEPDAANECQLNSGSIKQEVIDFAKPSQIDGEYHVTLQPDTETVYVSDESVVELAIGMMKNARPNDPIFQINWEEYCGSLDITG